jgi:solute:Na+ symporter, SSS family
VLQLTVFNAWHVPFAVTVTVTLGLIWLYTFRGGIKTIIYTDLLQGFFMLLALTLCIVMIGKELGLGVTGIFETVVHSKYSKIFFFSDPMHKGYFFKQFLSGALITIVMTGLDQDMMQKNLSCRNLKDAKKNMFWFSLTLVPINLFFLCLGVLLYTFATVKGIQLPVRSDHLFPLIATQGYLSPAIGMFFLVGLIAATYSTSDSALTALTTSFTVDILGIKSKDEQQVKRLRYRVHLGLSVAMIAVILLFKVLNDKSVIDAIYTIAGYTYGPLLGLYAFGLFTKFHPIDKFVPVVAILSPIICIILNYYSAALFGGYKFGYEILLLNGLLTFIGLWLIRQKKTV